MGAPCNSVNRVEPLRKGRHKISFLKVPQFDVTVRGACREKFTSRGKAHALRRDCSLWLSGEFVLSDYTAAFCLESRELETFFSLGENDVAVVAS